MIRRIIKIGISVMYLTVITIKNFILSLLNKELSDSCIVLFYHAVPDNYLYKFIKQLDYIQKKTIPVSLDFNKFSKKNTRYSIITFDDAFQSVNDNALPVLKKRSIPCTIFVPVGCLGQKPHWLKESNHPDEDEFIITKRQLKEIDKTIATIGSHTLSHSNLTTLNESDLNTELYESKIQLEKIMSYPVKTIAFPYGLYDKKVLDFCKKVGYENVFTIEPASHVSSIHTYKKGRVEIFLSDWSLEYRLKILGAYSWMSCTFMIKRYIKYLLHYK